MSTSTALAAPLARPWSIAMAPTATALSAARRVERVWEHLVVFAPLCLVPLAGTPADILALALLFALLIGADTALAALGSATLAARQWSAAAMLGAGFWLATAPILGVGAMMTLGLFVVVRCIDRQLPAAAWPARFALAALATALVVDLSLVTLAVERSLLWLALGAAIGTAFAAARLLDPGHAADCTLADEPGDGAERRHVLVETVLVSALVLVLALYAALLAHEPALAMSAVAGGYLTLPLLALAVLRLALVALSPARREGLDPLAGVLLASWALMAASLFAQA